MATKSVEVDVVPSFVAPSIMGLNVIAMMIPIDMETDTLVVLACDWGSVDIKRDLLVGSMSNGWSSSKTTMLAIPGGKKISVDVEASRER